MTVTGMRRALLLGTAVCALNAGMTEVALATVTTDSNGNVTITGNTGAQTNSTIAGTLSNAGTIAAPGSTGIEVIGSVGGGVTNTGTISATDGIIVGGNVGGGVTNAGSISAGIFGIAIDGNVGGGVTNTGSISAGLWGIEVNGTVGGGVTNTGSISAAGNTGIRVLGNVGGGITNTGSISAANNAVYIDGTAGALVNSGTLVSTGLDGFSIVGNVSGTVANTGSISAHYIGIFILDNSGGVTNAGRITTSSDNALQIQGTVSGGVTNSGLLSSTHAGAISLGDVTGDVVNTASGSIVGGAGGIRITSNAGGITNAGTIIASATGIVVNGSLGGGITNTGTISAVGRAIAFVPSASITVGTIDNGGTILSSGTTTNTGQTAIAIGTLTNVDTVSNSGLIQAYRRGIDNEGSITAFLNDVGGTLLNTSDRGQDFANNGYVGTVVNNGALIVTGTGSNTDGTGGAAIGANPMGIANYQTIVSLTNTGKISVNAASSATGIYNNAAGTLGAVVNTGTIIVSSVSAAGIGNYGPLGSIVNGGTISASGTSAYGIFDRGTIDMLSNTSTIMAAGTHAKGIYDVRGTIATLANSGLIDATGSGAIGLDVATSNGTIAVLSSLINSGSISGQSTGLVNSGSIGAVTNTGVISGGVRGLYVTGSLGSFTNSGTITAATAIDTTGETAPSTITQAGGQISGTINLSASLADRLDITGGTIVGAITGSLATVDLDVAGTYGLNDAWNVGAIDLQGGYVKLNHDVTVANGFTNGATLEVDALRTITGDFTQTAGANLVIGINGASSGELNVTHNATLAAASTLNLLELGPVTSAETYTIVAAGNTGSYGGITLATNPFLGLTLTTSIVGNDLILGVTPSNTGTSNTGTSNSGTSNTGTSNTGTSNTGTSNTGTSNTGTSNSGTSNTGTPNTGSTSNSGTSNSGTSGDNPYNNGVPGSTTVDTVVGPADGNTQSAATALLTLFQNQGPTGLPLLSAINSFFANSAVPLTTAQKVQVVASQLSPKTVSADTATSQQFTSAATTAVVQHIQTARAEENGQATGLAAGDAPENSAVWGQVLGFEARRASDFETAGDKIKNVGAAFGADTLVTDRWRLGASFAYGKSFDDGLDSAVGDSSRIDSYQLSGYGTYNGGPWYLDAQIGIGLANYDQSRDLIFLSSPAKANYDGTDVVAHVDWGYDLQRGIATLTPIAGLTYSHQMIDGYTESGTGLTIAGTSDDAVESELGGQVTWSLPFGSGILAPTAKLAWLHDWIRSNLVTTASLGGTSFTSRSDRPSTDGVDLGFALTFYSAGNWQVQAQYDGNYAHDYTSHAGILNVKMKF